MSDAGWIDRSGKVRLRFTGPDRAACLHNLTTQDVKGMVAGQSREAFVTTLQGKTLASVSILVEPEAILVRTDAPSREALEPHFRKYAALDDVTIEDVSESTSEVHLVGFEPSARDDRRIIPESLIGRPGWTVIDPRSAPVEWLELPRIDPSEFEGLRIAAGTLVSGVDVTPADLPQEFLRDERTISFRKGCYLGQETVARLDALGHVNRWIKGLRIEGDEVPPVGAMLASNSQSVGTIRSAGRLPGSDEVVALAMVRVKSGTSGMRLDVTLEGGTPWRSAVVVDLPMPPTDGPSAN
jgi:folate-binding protein YgfZ